MTHGAAACCVLLVIVQEAKLYTCAARVPGERHVTAHQVQVVPEGVLGPPRHVCNGCIQDLCIFRARCGEGRMHSYTVTHLAPPFAAMCKLSTTSPAHTTRARVHTLTSKSTPTLPHTCTHSHAHLLQIGTRRTDGTTLWPMSTARRCWTSAALTVILAWSHTRSTRLPQGPAKQRLDSSSFRVSWRGQKAGEGKVT